MKKTDALFRTPKKNKDKWHKGPHNAHNNFFIEEILQVISENFMEMLLDMVNQNI
jgi:hypothetical protein